VARICVVRQGLFPEDPRVLREVRALTDVDHEVDVVCARPAGQPWRERDGRVRIYRLPVPHARGGYLRYVGEYASFLVLATLLVAALHARRRYAIVQVNSQPDTLVLAALIPRLLGARVLLDLHECMPEFFATTFDKSPRHPAIRVIAFLEQLSIRLADYAITCTEPMRATFIARGTPPGKIAVVLNGADEAAYHPRPTPARQAEPDRFVLISHGTVEERYGLDTAIRAVALLDDEIPGLRLDIYGEGSFLPALQQLANDLGVAERVYFSGRFVPLDDLVAAIAAADVGIVGIKRDAYRDLTLCNKMYEFITMLKPVVIARTRSVEWYYDDSCFSLFESDDAHGLACAVRQLWDDPVAAQRLVRRAAAVNEPYRWPWQAQVYRRAVDTLLAGGDPVARIDAPDDETA
jgi:glycosyltransferase involved in cell wall biosynthesis